MLNSLFLRIHFYIYSLMSNNHIKFWYISASRRIFKTMTWCKYLYGSVWRATFIISNTVKSKILADVTINNSNNLGVLNYCRSLENLKYWKVLNSNFFTKQNIRTLPSEKVRTVLVSAIKNHCWLWTKISQLKKEIGHF